MEPQRWKEIDALFAQAQALPPEERAGYLAHACRGEADLRAEVEALLRADAEADAVGEGFLSGSALHAFSDLPAPAAPERVGPYRIVRELGRGGMGVVYLAERADGAITRRVALKLIRRAFDTAEARRRFLREREALARLEHPHIARLYDAGATADGQPFFVMAYVEGRPLDRYVREERVPLEGRLRLFLQVCEAVAYAHRRLVLHRDLKPSNVLVNEGADGQAQARLLDFGLAKVLAPSGPALTVTRAGDRRLTPHYASPEQIRGERLTTATDVYSLGVILYELLAERRPFHAEEGTDYALERAVCEAEPARPSRTATAASDGVTFEPVARARRLRGDLDNITLKALRKEPERRYQGVADLAADVRRYLEGRPVAATAPTPLYRAGRFLRRHRVNLGLVAGAVVLAVLGTLGAHALEAARLDRAPESFRFEEYDLLVLNAENKVLERLPTDRPYGRAGWGQQDDAAALLDVDGDGRLEALWLGSDPGSGRTVLRAKTVGADELLWEIAPSAEVDYPNKLQRRTVALHVWGFVAGDLDGEGQAEIILTAWDPLSFAGFILRYDAATGERMGGPYRHAGSFEHIASADLDGDGVQEVLAGGVSQHSGLAVLAVLDPRHLGGHGPSGGHYVPADMTPGLERAYIRFPRSALSARLRHDAGRSRTLMMRPHLGAGYVRVSVIDPAAQAADVCPSDDPDFQMRNRRLPFVVEVTLGLDLRPIEANTSDTRDRLARLCYELGYLDEMPTTRAHNQAYLEGIEYWDGEAWRSEPVTNKHWRAAVNGEEIKGAPAEAPN